MVISNVTDKQNCYVKPRCTGLYMIVHAYAQKKDKGMILDIAPLNGAQ